jgi:hypothetical protein
MSPFDINSVLFHFHDFNDEDDSCQSSTIFGDVNSKIFLRHTLTNKLLTFLTSLSLYIFTIGSLRFSQFSGC